MSDVTVVPLVCVWETTMGCNMRCLHCGSSCEDELDNELDTDEALQLIQSMKDVGLKQITLSGGEPTIREDIHILSKALSDANIGVTWISNGWLIDENMVNKALEAGVEYIAMSLDGLEETHDKIRRPGSFKKIIQTFDLLQNKGIESGAITTLNSINIFELEELGEVLLNKGIDHWQFQIGLPMGNMSHNKDELLLSPNDIHRVVDFAFEFSEKNKTPKIHLVDSIGYYNVKEIQVKQKIMPAEDAIWPGCGAGRAGFGVLSNGDVVPCTSIRNPDFIEGNVKDRTLIDIWLNGFSYFRDFSHNQLKGFCSDCMYSPVCLGGCANSRYSINGSLESDNEYCLYSLMIKRELEKIPIFSDKHDIELFVEQCESNNNYQLLNSYIQKIMPHFKDMKHEYNYLLNMLSYSYFKLELFEKAIINCQLVLEKFKGDALALKGLGLSQYSLGNIDEGKKNMFLSIKNTDKSFMEPYTDLITLLLNEKDEKQALRVYKSALDKDPQYDYPYFSDKKEYVLQDIFVS